MKQRSRSLPGGELVNKAGTQIVAWRSGSECVTSPLFRSPSSGLDTSSTPILSPSFPPPPPPSSFFLLPLTILSKSSSSFFPSPPIKGPAIQISVARPKAHTVDRQAH
ncbi:hypothetical protein BO99DRAFT_219302 [Aspergillus violaceofuscus CBS 115571]|uniref:Uncharacterized protein n=1 Tax=Aspergillus violaceofuscus (strain CBS 115571) TaxID=1450538 RepID=A0A2V5HK40_ASPV1|nr:hypothetical protein BO99DRAFT_219302 [Aspergillus violaceofuscus CBS 115571]